MKMFFWIIIFIVFFSILYLFSKTSILLAPITMQSPNSQVCFGSNCFVVELAQSPSEVENGLMWREKLEKDKGMLFIFKKEDIYPFWMKNTLIPLDIIWIDSHKKIVFIQENAQPCKNFFCPSINPRVKAKYVLEINGGLVNQLQLKVGDFALIQVAPGL